jgi:hypothetical protein
MSHKVTKKHFKEFQKYCEYYLDLLNLRSWRVAYRLEETKETPYRSRVFITPADLIATIRLAGLWDIKPTPRELQMTAFHEVLHLPLESLCLLARDKGVDEYILDMEHHRIIQPLEKLIGKKL